MSGTVRRGALVWADAVVDGTFFLLQNYLTDVWKMSFSNAAAFLNIWGGLYRILPIIIVFLACKSSSLVNFIMHVVSGVFSTTGLVLITYTALPGYRCHKNGEKECVGQKERALFITGMALIGVGRATRFAFSQLSIIEDGPEQSSHDLDEPSCGKTAAYLRMALILFFFATPAVIFFVFPYIREWYILFGVAAICMAVATVAHLSRFLDYDEAGSSPATVMEYITEFFHAARVEDEDPHEEFDLSGCLNAVVRVVLLYSSWIVCGMVCSIGNTYFVQQATHMDYTIGEWKPPLQVLQLIFLAFKSNFAGNVHSNVSPELNNVPEFYSFSSLMYSAVCCAVAAAVERRSVHAVRRHGLVDQPDDVRTPMSAFWLLFQVGFLGIVEAFLEGGIARFHKENSYGDCLGEAVKGLGYMCGALSVYVVEKISETGGGKGWFQHTLNRSRLDRYYWVLSAFSAVSLLLLIFGFVIAANIHGKRRR